MKLVEVKIDRWYIYEITTKKIVGKKSGYLTSTAAFGGLTRLRNNGTLPRGIDYSVGSQATINSR